MESLALVVAIMVFTIYASGIVAFVGSWFKGSKAKFVSNFFGAISIVSGCWLWFTLSDGNGFYVAVIPISLGVFAILNYRRRKG